MSLYVLFCERAFFFYLAGCFTTVTLSLRSTVGNRLLPQTYGAWIAAAFAAHHFLIPDAAQTWHYWWYIWQGWVIAPFPVAFAYVQKDAEARAPVMLMGMGMMGLCSLYAMFSALHHPLSGAVFFYAASAFEGGQILAMIIWSGPVIPLLRRIRIILKHWRKDTWTRRMAV